MSQLLDIDKSCRTSNLLLALSSQLCMLAFLTTSTQLFAAPALPEEMTQAIRSAMQTHPDVMVANSRMLSATSQVTAGDYRWYLPTLLVFLALQKLKRVLLWQSPVACRQLSIQLNMESQ